MYVSCIPMCLDQYFEVITGKGHHSYRGVSKVKSAVISFLKRNHIRYCIALDRFHISSPLFISLGSAYVMFLTED